MQLRLFWQADCLFLQACIRINQYASLLDDASRSDLTIFLVLARIILAVLSLVATSVTIACLET